MKKVVLLTCLIATFGASAKSVNFEVREIKTQKVLESKNMITNETEITLGNDSVVLKDVFEVKDGSMVMVSSGMGHAMSMKVKDGEKSCFKDFSILDYKTYPKVTSDMIESANLELCVTVSEL